MSDARRPAPLHGLNAVSRAGFVGMLSLCAIAAFFAPRPAGAEEGTSEVTVTMSASALPGKHYAWVASPTVLDAESDPRVQDKQFRARLQASLDKVLQAKGYQKMDDPDKADFYIAYRVGVRDLEDVQLKHSASMDTPDSAVVCMDGGCSQLVMQGNDYKPTLKTKTTEKMEGGLLVEVVEPRTIRVLWSARDKGMIQRKDAGKLQLDSVARATLASLPKANP